MTLDPRQRCFYTPQLSALARPAAISLALFTVACSTPAGPVLEAVEPTTTSTTNAPRTSTTQAVSTTSSIADPFLAQWTLLETGRSVPVVPQGTQEFAELLTFIERSIRGSDEVVVPAADLGHGEQIMIRALTRRIDTAEVLAALPDDIRPAIEAHLRARSELGRLHTAAPLETLPAWRIIDPAPKEDLLRFYQSAGEANGIDWQILAAINLVETGIGRIDGLSTAGARGPMQFLPTTWDEVAEGGDIDDPEDAIGGAARYLVRRGALDDISRGLWGYNNSDHYVNAVLEYAALMIEDPAVFDGLYHWEIYVGTTEGTLWLPSGSAFDEPTTPAEYLAENPWSRTQGEQT